MKSTRLLCTAAAAALVAGVFPSLAFAQVTTTQPDTPVDDADGEEEADSDEQIVVTGSRIRRPNDESAAPITTVTSEQIFQTGRVSIGDILNDLPQLTSSLGSQNSTGGLGTRGLNFLDLRGLGRARTLTLINGRRQVSADIINGVFSGQGASVDINTIPTDLVDRIDIVTGGTSAVYGSDAVAGVVNFVLKRDFEGLELRGQTGISDYGDAGNQLVSLTAGTNFAEGRGNIAINGEFAHQEDYYGSGRPHFLRNDAFVVVDTDGTPSSDGVPDRLFYRDLRSSTISAGGQLGFRYANAATAPCGVDSAGSSFTCGFLFQPNGTVTPQTGLRVGLGPNGNYIGGNGTASREGKLLVLSPDTKRYGINMLGHFEISPLFVPFFEAKYVRTEAFGSQSGPFFSQGQTLGDSLRVTGITDLSYFTAGAARGNVNREGIRLDNPFLAASARTTITQQLTAAINTGVNPNTGTAFGTTAAGIADRDASLAQVQAGTYRFSLRRNYLDLGIRDEQIVRETYRAVGGIRGDYEDFNYELSANYSEHKENNTITGNVNRQRFLLALDTTTNAAGQIVCRSQVTPAYTGADRGGNPAILAQDVASCVPINPFGDGSISQAARDYLTLPTQAEGKATQFVASGFVAGSLEKLFSLPGGPIAFSVGAEYRRETLSYDLDDLTSAGYAFYNALPDFSAPAFEVREAFAELSVPLIKDVTLLQELTLHGSGRVADYGGGAGKVYAYSGDVTWRPIRDLLLRGAYSRSVRAPYIGALFSQQSQNFTPAPADPCSTRNLANGSATRRANCEAAGRPANYDFVYTSSLEIRGGGNPDLEAETSDSLTLGGVFKPSFLPGLTISSDYYDIQVDNVITAVGAQQILNLCYDSPTLDNPFCALFQRAGAAGGPRGEQAFRVLEGSLLQSSANFAKLKVRGIDTDISYSRSFDWGQVNLRGVWTHVIQNDSFTDPARPEFKNVLTGELGNPQNAFNITTDLRFGNFTVGHTFRWLDKMYLNTWEDYNGVNDQPPQNIDYADVEFYPVTTYHDVRIGYDVTEDYNAYLGITNVGDTKPPFGVTGVGAGSGIYDNRGRFLYAGFTARF